MVLVKAYVKTFCQVLWKNPADAWMTLLSLRCEGDICSPYWNLKVFFIFRTCIFTYYIDICTGYLCCPEGPFVWSAWPRRETDEVSFSSVVGFVMHQTWLLVTHAKLQKVILCAKCWKTSHVFVYMLSDANYKMPKTQLGNYNFCK